MKSIAEISVREGKTWRSSTALPGAVLRFGRVPDFDMLHPGDLILVKSNQPDLISRQIQRVQALGYGGEFAVWTHAAIYLGDELMLCEAQFDPANLEFGVQVAPFWNYFDGHDILVKRSKHAPDREGGWAIATAAATKIGNAYDWQFILELIRKRLMFGEDVWLEDQTGAVSSNAFVCSSLYSTAHAYATDVTISDKLNGLCVPAYLAMNTRHFETVDLQWCKIA
jgi:hypothetical protein